MRRLRQYLFIATAAVSLAPAAPSLAQYGGGPNGPGTPQHGAPPSTDQDDAKKKKRDEEFGNGSAPLPALKNAGPCPFVKSLYDAARYVEFKDNVEASADVGYTGEIENITSMCEYKGVEPIRVQAQVLFELGRGPQATSNKKNYVYWVAVTDRNHAVLGKQWFELPVTFPGNSDRVSVTEHIGGVTIPRANANVSGGNFEILVGFEVTPQMVAFNHDGKRFRANAGQTPPKVAAAAP
jgi:hypothetical protein